MIGKKAQTETVPPITHPLGRYWEQPDTSKITLNETKALMDRKAFGELLEYSFTFPTGVYAGKMWKALVRDRWMLRWYVDSEKLPGHCEIRERAIEIPSPSDPTRTPEARA